MPSTSLQEKIICILVRTQSQPSFSPLQHHATQHATAWSQQRVPIVYSDLDSIEIQGSQLFASGWMPDLSQDGWLSISQAPIGALYNRFPSQRNPQGLQNIADLAAKTHTPFANHPTFQAAVWDKWNTDLWFARENLPVPESVQSNWLEALQQWGTAYLKPRWGAFGEGIYYWKWISKADIVVEGPTQGKIQHFSSQEAEDWFAQHPPDAFLQRAIAPPIADLRGFCIRTLLQRTATGTWQPAERVARISRNDAVANVARGAQAQPLFDLCMSHWDARTTAKIIRDVEELEQNIAKACERTWSTSPSQRILEMGVDIVLAPDLKPWVLEINGFPQGRLEQLAHLDPQRFEAAIRDAHTRPLEALCHWASL